MCFEDKPLLSVIVPIYNVETYLEKCVNSIIHQTYKNLEIILVDDGSTDKCSELCDKYASIDKRIIVIHKPNGGLVSARKAGVLSASGIYVTYVDGDDWIDKGLYDQLFSAGMKYDVDIVSMSGYIKEYEDGNCAAISNQALAGYYTKQDFKEKVFPFIINTDRFYATDISVHVWSHLFKRDLLFPNQLEVDDRICFGEDVICFLSCVLKAQTIMLTKVYGYHYVQRNDSITQIYTGNEYSSISVLYRQLNKVMSNCAYRNMMRKKIDFVVIYALLMNAYDALLNVNSSYLFPFSNVKPYSNIVIYGAGAIGKEMMRVLSINKDYNVVLWIDRGYEKYRKLGFAVDPPEKVALVDFDYLVITVADKKVESQIKKTILDMGIDERKIAQIDLMVISQKALPDDLREESGMLKKFDLVSEKCDYPPNTGGGV